MPKRALSSLQPAPHTQSIDADEQAWRMEVVEEAIRMNTDDGFDTDLRCRRLCEEFIEGRLTPQVLTREVIRLVLN